MRYRDRALSRARSAGLSPAPRSSRLGAAARLSARAASAQAPTRVEMNDGRWPAPAVAHRPRAGMWPSTGKRSQTLEGAVRAGFITLRARSHCGNYVGRLVYGCGAPRVVGAGGTRDSPEGSGRFYQPPGRGGRLMTNIRGIALYGRDIYLATVLCLHPRHGPTSRWRAMTWRTLAGFSAVTVALGLCTQGCGSGSGGHSMAKSPPAPQLKEPEEGLHIEDRLESPHSHRPDVELVYSSTDKSIGWGSALISALPCTSHRYAFVANANALSSIYKGSYRARLVTGSVSLPAGITCDHRLPPSFTGNWFFISVIAMGGKIGVGPRFTISGHSMGEGVLKGRFHEGANTSLCPGRYEFIAFFRGSGRTKLIRIPFTLSHIVDIPEKLWC